MAPKVTLDYKLSVRERILQATSRLFGTEGYHETSMDDVVRESGLSKGAIYGYFKSKEELFAALQEREISMAIDEMKARFSPKDSAPEKLRKVVELTFQPVTGQALEKRRISLEFYAAAPRIRSIQLGIQKRYRTIHSFFTEIIRNGIKKGELRPELDPDSVATVLIAISDGLALHSATRGLQVDWNSIRKALITAVGFGIIPAKGLRARVESGGG